MNNYNQMTTEEKVNYFFQKFRTNYDEWNIDESSSSSNDNLIENRLILSKLRYLPKDESEKIRDRYSELCDTYALRNL